MSKLSFSVFQPHLTQCIQKHTLFRFNKYLQGKFDKNRDPLLDKQMLYDLTRYFHLSRFAKKHHNKIARIYNKVKQIRSPYFDKVLNSRNSQVIGNKKFALSNEAILPQLINYLTLEDMMHLTWYVREPRPGYSSQAIKYGSYPLKFMR